MSLNLPFPPGYYLYSAGILLGPIGCIILLILQICAKHQKNAIYHIKHRPTFILLIVIYLLGVICGLFGFTMHSIPHSGDYCERYGIVACFAALGGGKDVMYLLFIQRAKVANGENLMSRRKRIIFDVVFPIYVLLHWLCYLIGTALLWPAISLRTFQDGAGLTFCIFGHDTAKLVFLTVATVIDALNCVVFLYIFVVPLLHLMKETERTKVLQAQREIDDKRALLRVMKWNFVLAFVATLSSCLSLLCLLSNAIWLGCLFDPLVNSICSYFMMKPNRSFAQHLFCCTTYTCSCKLMGEEAEDEAKRSHVALEGI
mmetsp:Transcript_20660/g.32918  ORF Transcript_20660/g.32918 Transcript_20660/m.32918 type:complete len:315 (+) Transcript_20660:14-958(+)